MTTLPVHLVRKYDRPGPRYTSYPTALEFSPSFGPDRHAEKLRAGAVSRPLSLYFHLPFCKQVCYFCGCNVIYTGNRERAHPYVDELVREMDLVAPLLQTGREVTQLHWGGGTPTFLRPELIVRLGEAIRERFRFAKDAEISVEIDPREASDLHLEALRAIGFTRASMGVQDFDADVQKAVHRIQPFELTAGRMEKLRALGFNSVNLDLMYGLPRQTLATLEDTLARTITLRPDRIAFFNFAYLPTLKNHMRRIRAEELPNAAEKLAMLALAVDRLTAAGYRYIGMDHFVLPDDELSRALDDGTLHRNFQGYTTRAGADMIGIGVTSISDLGDAYVQNVKTEHEYSARLTAGKLPTERGVTLTAADQLRRWIIMTLMSRFALDYAELSRRMGTDAQEALRPEWTALQTFADDGLVEFHTGGMRVTETGRFLIRNICMVFDEYLNAPEKTARFSRTV